MKNGTMSAAARAKASGSKLVLSNAHAAAAPRPGESGKQVERTSLGATRLDNLMSKSGVDGTQDHAVDPSEQTETRTRSRVESVDENWDLDEPVATKVASLPPLAVTKSPSIPPSTTEQVPSIPASPFAVCCRAGRQSVEVSLGDG